MIDFRLHHLIFVKATILLLALLPRIGCAETYDNLVAMMQNSSLSARTEAKDRLAHKIKKSILVGRNPDLFTENTFLFGHFINSHAPDLAVGISAPPREGNLVVLTKRNGRYLPIAPVTGIGFIESMESVKLFPCPLEQIVLNLFGGGTGERDWDKDIYRWDGTKMRMIWAWVRKNIYAKWFPKPEDTVGHVIRSEINFVGSGACGPKEIHTCSMVDEGIFPHQKGHELDLEKVTSHVERCEVHRWDDSLFFYIAKHGEISSPEITVSCQQGIPQREEPQTLHGGMRVGILNIPGVHRADDQTYHAVIGKEHFCEIPKSAVHILDEGK